MGILKSTALMILNLVKKTRTRFGLPQELSLLNNTITNNEDETLLHSSLEKPEDGEILVHILYKKSRIGKLLLTHRSEDSILDNPEGFIPYDVNGRKRLATCAGISWFAGRYLAAVNLYGGHLRIYKLEETDETAEGKMRLRLIHQLSEGIGFPDNVGVSPDASMMAVSHSLSNEKGVSLRRIDKMTFEPKSILERVRIEYTCHGVHFSPDSRYLAFTTIDGPGSTEVYDVSDLPMRCVCLLANNHKYLRPKDVCFTADSKYVAIIYSETIAPKYVQRTNVGKRLAIHRFDINTGVIDEKSVAVFDSNNYLFSSFELASFSPIYYPDEYRLFITNQAYDKVLEIVFNPIKCSLQVQGTHSSDLSFPHGIDVSADGKLIAVSNFGTDQILIFQLERVANEINDDTRPHILLCGHTATRHIMGAERSLIDLARTLSKLGYKISCLLPNENIAYTDELAQYADAVFQLDFDWTKHRRPFDEKYVSCIQELIQRESIDIVHSNSLVVPDVLTAARRAGIPRVLHARELLAEDQEITDYLGRNSEEILQHLAEEADFIIANSKATQQQFLKYGDSFCLYNAIDLDKFNLAPIHSDEILRVGMISNNSARKGVHDFIELAHAAHTEPNLEFYLIGPKNPDLEKIEDELKNIPDPSKLHFIDYVSDSVQAISMIDVVVNLSTIGESFGRTVAEGMAARRPVIVYDRGAMSELVQHRESGFIVPPGNVQEVLGCLNWLLKNRTEALKMGESGRHFVETHFSFDHFQNNLKFIYEQIIANSLRAVT